MPRGGCVSPFEINKRGSPQCLAVPGTARVCQEMRKRKYSVLTGESVVPEDAPTPMVHNIVATCQINSTLATLDLESIHAMLPFSFYDKRKFAAITIRLHDPACTTLLFSSGKTVVTGGRFVPLPACSRARAIDTVEGEVAGASTSACTRRCSSPGC